MHSWVQGYRGALTGNTCQTNNTYIDCDTCCVGRTQDG